MDLKSVMREVVADLIALHLIPHSYLDQAKELKLSMLNLLDGCAIEWLNSCCFDFLLLDEE